MSGHAEWRMRTTSGQAFGPVALDTLRVWACDGRVGPEDEIREGDGPWRRAGNVPDLGMDWLLELPGGELYGPVPLAAFLDMLREGAISPDLKVRRRDEIEGRRLGDLAIPSVGTEAPGLASPVPAEPISQGPVSGPAVSTPDGTPSTGGESEPARSSPVSPPSASSIHQQDEERMISELRSALGVGRGLRVFSRLRPGRPDAG